MVKYGWRDVEIVDGKYLEDLKRKAKAFDEIKEFITRKLKEEEEEKPRTLLSDYDYGLYQAYDNVDDIIQEYLERADDER
ncbi:hypothetical protein [Staphylococcus saprophyticus]|uniref:hypothetical protein n=1 Tax=Staphylococcus saprophyticus TaxID=29385 RepID=UPI0008534BE7|nr:hypothetical protein [Staphylococcus saprophyticus]OEK22610.1 hypothetical protein ASS82_04470 [Staphylococcus saprophyticus]